MTPLDKTAQTPAAPAADAPSTKVNRRISALQPGEKFTVVTTAEVHQVTHRGDGQTEVIFKDGTTRTFKSGDVVEIEP